MKKEKETKKGPNMKTAFLEFIGNTPSTRLLDFLITGREFDYSLTDLAENAHVSWSTLHRIFPRFEKQKIVLKTREVGRAKLYKLNTENPRVEKLIALYDAVVNAELEKADGKHGAELEKAERKAGAKEEKTKEKAVAYA